MKTNENKVYRIYEKSLHQWFEVPKDYYETYDKERTNHRKREQYHGRCCCPRDKWWLCDMICEDCEYRRAGDTLSLDAPEGDGSVTMLDQQEATGPRMEDTSVLNTLKSATTVKTASDAVLTGYERPSDQGDAVKEKRAGYGQTYFDKYAGTKTEKPAGTCTAAKVIAVAVDQIGYKEKASNTSLDSKTANAGSANYTKYARDFDQKYPKWYNGKKNGFAWCDMFVDWCFLTAFGYEKALALLCQPERSAGAGCTYSLRYFKNKGQFHTKDPQPGDQIFFGTSLDNSTHTGIVESVDKKQVHTIEGNTSNQVARRNYSLTNSRILGYGRPAYDAAGTVAPVTPATPAAPQVTDVPFLVKVSIRDLNIRKGPGTNYSRTGSYTGIGVFTIVDVQSGQGSSSGWGKLKSGAGWISLDYCKKL